MSHLAAGHLLWTLFIVCGQKSTEVICHAVILLPSCLLSVNPRGSPPPSQGMMGKFNHKRTCGVKKKTSQVDFCDLVSSLKSMEIKSDKSETKTTNKHVSVPTKLLSRRLERKESFLQPVHQNTTFKRRPKR